jgi:hypothetical protein
MNLDPAKQAWLSSVEIGGPPPLEEVRKGADKFYRIIKWRNRVEYFSCAVAIAVFGYLFATLPHIAHKVGAALVIAAAIFGPWQLHRRASAVSPDLAGTMPIYVFLRGQLVRQRDALKTIFGWYVLPFLPGLALIVAGNGLDPEIEAAGPPIWVRWLTLASFGALGALAWWINQLGVRGLQKRIDGIDALMEGSE